VDCGISRAHELLAKQYRVIVFEVPGFGACRPNERSASMGELAPHMAQAVTNLGIGRFNLMGNSSALGWRSGSRPTTRAPRRVALLAPSAHPS